MNEMQGPPWTNPRFRNWIALIRAHRAVAIELAKVLAPFNLKAAQLDLLMNVHRHPGLSQQELAERLLVGRSNVTMLLPPLEEQKLIIREADASDKRVLRLTLTPEGEALLDQALAAYAGLVDRVMSSSSEAECNQVGETMNRVAEMLKDGEAR